MKRLTFKVRIIIFTGIIIVFTACTLTLVSMYNAQKQIQYFTASIKLKSEAIPMSDEKVTWSVAAEAADTDEKSFLSSNEKAIYSVTSNTEESIVLSIDNLADQATHGYNAASAAALIFIIIFGMTAAYFFVGKSLKPIRSLSHAVSRITEKDLSLRLPKCGTKDEISSLTDSFNSMLERLEEAFERQKRFSSNAAHELKTPVAIIKTGLQTLRMEENPMREDYEETFEIIKRSTERLSDVIDDLLTLTNGNTLPTETFSLNALLRGIVQDMMPQYVSKKIEIFFAFPQTECFITVAETLAYRFFYNVIENAFKYNRQGGKIYITVTERKGEVVVCIQDTGIGISKSNLPYIWETFYCVDPSRSKKQGGVGLGLSVVKEIAKRFEWNISVNSMEKIGTQFIIKWKNAQS